MRVVGYRDANSASCLDMLSIRWVGCLAVSHPLELVSICQCDGRDLLMYKYRTEFSACRIRGAFNDDMPRISSQFNSAKSLLSSRLQGPSLYQGAMRYPPGLVGIFVNTGSSPINCRIPDWLIRRLDNGRPIENRLIILGV